MIYRNLQTRRHFLLGTGKLALALPFLSSLWPEKVWAGQGRKKFVGLIMYYGQRHEFWDPALSLESNTYNFGDVRIRTLTESPASGVNKIIGSAFNPYLSKANFIKGLDVITDPGHNDGCSPLGSMSKSEDWETIDQVLAASSKFYQNQIPAMDSLYISTHGSGVSRKKLGAGIVALPSLNNPQAIFDRIFFSSAPADRQRNIKVVDRVLASYNTLKGNSRISAADKVTVENFIDRLNETENRIRNQRPLEGTKPAAPTYISSSTKDYFRVLVDLGILALQTESTQVLTMGIQRIPLLTEADGFPPAGSRPELDPRGVWHEDHHLPESILTTNYSNNTDKNSLEAMLMYNQWHTNNVILPFIKGMDGIMEANGKTMLDNSLVLWGNELARSTHESLNMPVVLFGSAGGTIQTNRYLDYSRRDTAQGESIGLPSSFKAWRGLPYNRLMVSIMQALGLAPEDYERPGIKGYGAYTSLRASTNAIYAPVIGAVDQMLPRFKA